MRRATVIVVGVFLPLAAIRCSGAQPPVSPGGEAVLRIGIDQLARSSASTGIRPFVENLSVEGLLKIDETGRPQPGLAQSWTVSSDGLTVALKLRPNVAFHDTSPADAEAVAEILRRSLPGSMGAAYADVLSITPQGHDTLEFKLQKPSKFLLEALEAQVKKPATPYGIGTGPFAPAESEGSVELLANPNYYLGQPTIQRITLNTYPSVRNAWAEMLRNNLDMVYEVGINALDSLQSSSTIKVFSYRRHYQYLVLLNSRVEALRAASVRRALNAAVDRDEIVRLALNGHGTASAGPIWPQHWALANENHEAFTYDPQAAVTLLKASGSRVKFVCLVPASAERLALVLQQQLEAVGVDMELREVTDNELTDALLKTAYDAILVDTVTAPSIFRSYVRWHSQGPFNRNTYSNPDVDAALDLMNRSTSDEEYRLGVGNFQKAILNDPPAIFLAWTNRARAVSRRLAVQGAEPGFDILGTIRLWRPAS